jgi:hypothetical protein
MRYRDKRGRYTKFDRRKWVYDNDGKLANTPASVWRQYPKAKRPVPAASPTREKPKGKKRVGARAPVERYVDVDTHTDRTGDRDLYKYFGDKKVNQKVASLKKKHPKKIIVASVEIRIGKRRMETREFKLTDIPETRFIGGNRKGRKYSPKDVVAYFVHDRVNDTDYTIYKRTTDTHQLIKRKGKRKRYDKRQSYKINYRAVSKTAAKAIPTVGKFPKVKKGRSAYTQKPKRSRGTKVPAKSRKRR